MSGIKRGTWNTLSFDEICHNDELRTKYKIDPAKDAVQILKGITNKCLSELGIEDPWNEITVRFEMLAKGIHIKELDYEGAIYLCEQGHYAYNPSVLGWYIYEGFEVRYFISYAYVNSSGRVFFDVQDFVHEKQWKEGDIQIRIK